MTPISPLRFQIPTGVSPILSHALATAIKVSDLAIAIFQACQGAIIILLPVRETPKDQNFCQFCNNALHFTNPDQFEMLANLHGAFLLGSGVTGGVAALVEMSISSSSLVAGFTGVLNPISVSLFVISKVFSLTYSSVLVNRTFQKKNCFRLRQIFFIHALSTVNAACYIAAVASRVFGGPVAFLGGVALSAGGLRIFYELFYYNSHCKIN